MYNMHYLYNRLYLIQFCNLFYIVNHLYSCSYVYTVKTWWIKILHKSGASMVKILENAQEKVHEEKIDATEEKGRGS